MTDLKKYFKNTILLLAFMLILGACSKNEQETEASEPKEIEQQEEEEAKEEEDLLDEEDVDEHEEEVEMDNSDISSLLEEIEMITEGEVELMYESKEPQVNVEEEYKLSLDHYAVIHIKDFHSRFSIPFDEKDEGVIVLSH